MIYLQVSFKIATKLKNKMERSTDELASSHGSDLHRSNYLDLFAPPSETRRSAVALKSNDLKKLGMSDWEIEQFLLLRNRYLQKESVDWSTIQPAPTSFLVPSSRIEPLPSRETTKDQLSKMIVVALNGGLGERMGMKGMKSALQIIKRGNVPLTFFDCSVAQIEELNREYGVDIPLVLLNSKQTEEETKRIIHKYQHRIKIITVVQSSFPKMYKHTLAPLPQSEKDEGFYPPGSGEIFAVLKRSGHLDSFLAEGKQFLFISNIENLGGTVEPQLLNHFAKKASSFMLEVTQRISTDQFGGIPILYKEKEHILELSQIPTDLKTQFSASKGYKYWNTNNTWVKLDALAKIFDSLTIDFVVRQLQSKHQGHQLLQIETPVSMSLHSFPNPLAVEVSRTRFRPIKTTSDLLLVQSDLFSFNKGIVIMNPKREPQESIPLVKLGEEFTKLTDYEKRFKTVPNVLELDHLTVSGDVYFGANVTLKGTVIVVADTGSRIDLPDNTILENKIVSGDLVIQDY